MVSATEGQQADFFIAGGLEASFHHLTNAGDAAFADGTSDHSGLAEAASASAPTEDLDAHAFVDCFGQRHERLLGERPFIQIHHGVLGHSPWCTRLVSRDATNPSIVVVIHVIESRNVDASGFSQAQQDFFATAWTAFALPLTHDRTDH